MKHRAIARERNEAAKEGRLPAWYAKRAAEAPSAPPTPPTSPFDNAYPATGGERGPIGTVWREDERWPTWSLPTQVASPRGRY
jgi:hypothetical protein